jgi:hypothetical protein
MAFIPLPAPPPPEHIKHGGSAVGAGLLLLVAATQVTHGTALWYALWIAAGVAISYGGLQFLKLVPWRRIGDWWRQHHPPLRIQLGGARRLPIDDDGMGLIEVTGLRLDYRRPIPLTLNLQVVHHTPKGFLPVGSYHVQGPETVQLRHGETHMPPLCYKAGPFGDEKAFMEGRATVWLTTPSGGQCWTIPLFETKPIKAIPGVRIDHAFSQTLTSAWKAETDTFREDARVVWPTLKGWFGRSVTPDYLERIVYLAPWPDIREGRSEENQAANLELTMLCERACARGAEFTPVSNARARIESLVVQWQQRIGEIDGFVCWLRGPLDWSIRTANQHPALHNPYHARTLKLLWYLGLAVAKDSQKANPNYSAFASFRDAMDGEDFKQ